MRYFIHLAYFGKNFSGWQIQPNAFSVQQALNENLTKVLGFNVNVVGAGRTDTGVHAKQMYAHFDHPTEVDNLNLLRNKLNKMLGSDIVVYDFIKVDERAHARFDAISRKYEYHICRAKNPFLQDVTALYKYYLNKELIIEATELLVGERDYSSFSKSRTQTHTNICNITEAYWDFKEDLWVFHISANRFLRNMVRAIVGSLLEVGKERMSPKAFEEMIKAKDRKLAGESVPPQGLYLVEVSYPKEILNGR